jgi:hemoglobin
MQPLTRRRTAALLACALAVGLAAAAPAADDKPAPVDPKALDQYIYASLRSVINQGVDLYNSGEADRCYQHFRRSLEALAPVLTNHPDLKKSVETALKEVDGNPEWRARMAAQVKVRTADGLERPVLPSPQLVPPDVQKAFALRAVLNDVRAGVGGEGRPERPVTATLWDRLGGQAGVARVVDDFVAIAAADPKVNFDRGGKVKLDPGTVDRTKKGLIEFISQATGGPLRYTGPGMKEVHKGMGITNAEFDASVADLRKALQKNNVKPADADALVQIVQTTRKDIVEPKPPESSKPEGGTVKGTVHLDGKPLTRGSVVFTGEDGKTYTRAIAADGTYAVENIPEGTYKVSVSSARDNVPAKYANPNTSGLTATVKKGANTRDIDLSGEKGPAKPDEKPRGEASVSGKVTFKGKPLPAGNVGFHPKDGKGGTVIGPIHKDGTYSVSRLLVGEYVVTVETESVKKRAVPKPPQGAEPAKGGEPAKGAEPANYVAIPNKYADAKTSGLTYKAVKGEQTFDIDLQ